MPSSKIMVGICAYNEEGNIGNLLQNLISEQNLPKNCMILVICSGCTDRTPEIVMEFAKMDGRVKFITEKFRKGKANALNKIFEIAKKSAEILILVNADALPERGSINNLLNKLKISNVGAVFAQPVPFMKSGGVCYKIVYVIWRLHHLISIYRKPKLSGELCAVRTACLHMIPENVATDEPYIEFFISKKGYKILYDPEALVYIRCPTNLSDLLKQRRRIWIGHLQFQNMTKYYVSTSSLKNVLQVLSKLKMPEIFYVFLGGFLELVAYFQAKAALKKKKIPFIWEPIKSTKIQIRVKGHP